MTLQEIEAAIRRFPIHRTVRQHNDECERLADALKAERERRENEKYLVRIMAESPSAEPTQKIFIADMRVAMRSDDERSFQNEIAKRLNALGPERDCALEIRFPRTMAASTPLFSALDMEDEALRNHPFYMRPKP